MYVLMSLLLLVIYVPENVPEEVGSYRIEYSHEEDGITISDEFNLTVTSKNTIKYEDYAIDASDFYVTDEDNINEELIINNSDVKIWNMKTLEEYGVSNVNFYKVKDKLYEAVITSENNLEVKINIFIIEDEEYMKKLGLYPYEDKGSYSDPKYTNYSIFKPITVSVLLIIYVLIFLIFYSIFNIKKSIEQNVEAYMVANQRS